MISKYTRRNDNPGKYGSQEPHKSIITQTTWPLVPPKAPTTPTNEEKEPGRAGPEYKKDPGENAPGEPTPRTDPDLPLNNREAGT